MNILPIIFDSAPSYLGGASATTAGGDARPTAPRHSLLTLPLGTATMLSHLAAQLRGLGTEPLRVLPPPLHAADYTERIRRASIEEAEVITPVELAALLHQREPADYLLIIDPSHWPVEGYDFDELISSSRNSRWAVHAVSAQASHDGTQEFVRCDERGYVRRVRRYYDRVTWPQTGTIPYSLVTVAAVEDVPFESLTQIRSALVARGMLSQDLPLCSGVAELADARTLLALCERFAIDAVEEGAPDGYVRRGPGVLAGTDCSIAADASIIGPVVVQRGVSIGAGAVVIGPAVIGGGATIESGARLVQSVVCCGATVRTGATVRHRVVFSDACGCEGDDEAHADPAVPVAFLPRGADSVRLAEEALKSASGARSWYPAVKRAIDVVVSLAGLVVIAPLMFVISVLVKLDSRGPIFFAHEREGRGGKVFRCVKFRTMRADAHQLQRQLYKANNVDGPQFKMDNDPRVTRMGRILRATNLDEVPQLFNVLVGQMSLVGPRPSPFRENQICVPWRRARLSVRPGITGLWQVCRHDRAQGDFHQWIAYDTMYVSHLSFLVDLKVVLATMCTLGGKWSVPESWMVPRRHRERLPEARPAPALADMASTSRLRRTA